MSNVSDIKPLFREDLARTLMSIYFASKSSSQHLSVINKQEYETGFAAALASVAIAVGVNPETFLSPEDMQALRKVQ